MRFLESSDFDDVAVPRFVALPRRKDSEHACVGGIDNGIERFPFTTPLFYWRAKQM